MRVTFLGTGTSTGVPMIGCDCPVCTSPDPRNRRRRTSLYIEAGGVHLVVDTPPDFREQALAYKIPRVDALIFTHSHADHIFGFDDIRRFNTIQGCVIPAYGSADTLRDLRRIYDYVNEAENPHGLYRPRVEFREITGPFAVGGVRVDPFPVEHGSETTLGYRFEEAGRTFAYAPDCVRIAEAHVRKLEGVDVMILDALRHRPHTTHFTVEASVGALRRIKAGRSYLIHMSHELDHGETQKGLPESMHVSYDGLTLRW